MAGLTVSLTFLCLWLFETGYKTKT
jgi:hypothetical protein